MPSKLFEPIKVGNVTLKHRITMAPLTRFRADANNVPLLPMVKDYYAQRGTVPGTLLITEATFVSAQAGGFDFVPGLWDPAMTKAWKEVTDAVHAKGSYIYCQLWCLGRAATAKVLQKQGLDVVSSGDIPISEKSSKPRPMSEDEIWTMIGSYASAARNAVEEAGFDGVEIHGANGYMVDQFTQDTCNNRIDQWGGSIENRARFGLEVAKAVCNVIGPNRVGIRLSPYSEFQGMRMKDPIPQFTYLINRLSELKLAYLHMTTPRVQGATDVKNPIENMDWAVEAWKDVSPVMLAGAYRPDTAVAEVDKKFPDRKILIAFGRLFIANPDLPYRAQKEIDLNRYDRSTFYTPYSEKGYTDYPFSKEWEKAQSRL